MDATFKNYVKVSKESTIRIRNYLSGKGSRRVKEALEKGASFISTILLQDPNIGNLYNYYIGYKLIYKQIAERLTISSLGG